MIYLSFYAMKWLCDKCLTIESILTVYRDVRVVRRVWHISQGRFEFMYVKECTRVDRREARMLVHSLYVYKVTYMMN